ANQSAKGGKSSSEIGEKRPLHLQVKVRGVAGDEYEVEWTLAHDLIGHVVVATLVYRVSGMLFIGVPSGQTGESINRNGVHRTTLHRMKATNGLTRPS